MIDKIEWSELKPYQNHKYRSFEELCYQIAKGLYGEKGRFTSIDDSGGGDGVEFYLTLPNGDQWGWQAKFYESGDRLSQSNRKQSITNSLNKACEIHPRLKKWILCTASNLTPKEQTWFGNTLRQSIPPDMDVDLEHWGDSEFNAWLSEPRFSGKLHYFFGELELNLDWFKTQFNKQIVSVGEKFNSSLHTETRVDANLHALLGDKVFVHQITELIEKPKKELSDLEERINDLKGQISNKIKWEEEEKSKVIEAAESLQHTLVNTIGQVEQAIEFLNTERFSEAQAVDWEFVLSRLEKASDTYETIGTKSGVSNIKYIGEPEDERQILHETADIIYRPGYLISSLLLYSFHHIRQWCELINWPDLHIFGDAGVGKTHIACNICEDRLESGLPALFIRGILFTSDRPVEEQLLGILDIPPSYSWRDFLQALSTAAEAYHTRIPLIIDGLNESTHNGTFSNVWRLGLKRLVHEISEVRNVVLITTYRTSYTETIWGDENPLHIIVAEGFDAYDEVEQAVGKYFKAYKITADLTGEPLVQFRHPIYLKIFCETINSDRETEKYIYVGEQVLFDVFDRYLGQCNRMVCDRLGLHPKTTVVQSALNEMTEHLWQYNSRYIPFEELVRIIDDQSRGNLDWLSSKTYAIEGEGLLVYRDWGDIGEVMHFTYDLLGGYLIAKYLLEQAGDDPQGFLCQEEIVASLFGEDYQTLHPMHEDISRCVAALLPAKTGKFLHQFLDNEKAFYLSICTLFEISPKYINEDCLSIITCLFELPQCRKPLLELAETTVGHPDHPFNATFWSERLLALSMAERDLSWSEYIRLSRESFEKRLNRFEETCQSDQDLSDIGKERLHLMAEYTMWILTSTVRPLRDQATRALYWYGRRFPQEFFDLVMKSFTINDPYVSERMLAATYGIAMARQNDFEDTSFVKEVLPLYARELYETMFKPDAPHLTTHILARDYAKRTIDIALIYHPDLLTADEQERIIPPYTDGGIREWGESKRKEEGFSPIQMDFENYTLRGLIKSDNKNPNEHKNILANVYWRLYELKFTNERFGDIDGLIVQANFHYGRSGDGRKTDRYGKKYSWIAYFELAGFRQDQGNLPDFYDNGRCIEADIDPSFPDKHREHNLVREDFLDDRETSTAQWVLKTPHPDLTPYLNVDQLWDQQSSWVLLHGYLGQEDKSASRKMSAWMQGLIVKPENVDEIVDILNRQENIDGHTVPFIPEDYRTYAGEIPWCDTYPPNNWQEFSFLVRKYTIPKKELELLHDGEPISLIDDFELWDTIRTLIETDDERRLNELLRERNFEIRIKTVDEERFEHKDFEVLVPVRYNCWEESRSAANPRRSIALPNREISDCSNLYKKPQSFDLFEKDSNRRASISFEYGDIWSNSQNFTYLRKDLLDNFLAEICGELIWVIWGNRLLVSENYDGPYKNFQEVKTYRDIQKASGDS